MFLINTVWKFNTFCTGTLKILFLRYWLLSSTILCNSQANEMENFDPPPLKFCMQLVLDILGGV